MIDTNIEHPPQLLLTLACEAFVSIAEEGCFSCS